MADKFTTFAGTANPDLAEAVAGGLGVRLGVCSVERFPDGEVSVRLDEPVRGREVFVVQPTSPPVNDRLVELLALADACRRASAERVTAVVPYFGYARSEEKPMIFRDRADAGRRLAAHLTDYADRPGVLVLALPRGGVPVAFEVAQSLDAPLDIFLVRKLGVPGQEELAMGAIATGGVRVVNEDTVRYLNIPGEVIDAVAMREQEELERRERAYRGGRPAPDVKGRMVILVDDGLATGSTMRAAARALRRQQPARLVVAVPVSSPQTCDEFREEVDDIVCAVTPEPFRAVGLWYEDFSQTTDEEVSELLERAARGRRRATARGQ